MIKRFFILGVVVVLVAGAVSIALSSGRGRKAAAIERDPVARGCALGPQMLVRIERGRVPGRSEDVITVPQAPNYLGSFAVNSHSGPWDYLQRVPLVAYGPERVPATGRVEGDATLADIFPTVEDWTHTELGARAGTSLTEAVSAAGKPAKLIVFVMWDGVGRNVLERWPGRWPNLERLERDGTSYLNATVGSSPSITPATHATLGTGAFPTKHGITGIHYRGDDDAITVAFEGRRPADLALTTFADELDQALRNEAKVGLVGLRSWHMPMMGHGAAIAGGDRDQLALIGFDQTINGNRDLYQTPSYLHGFPGLQDHIDRLDQADGVSDGRWRGHDIAETQDNPAWVRYETDVVREMWDREAYGADAITDLFFVNYKMTDTVGHYYSIDSQEMADTLEAQDEALGELVAYLDDQVRDYVIVVTADHGHTPSPERSGAWPIGAQEMEDDINARFEIAGSQSLISQRSAVGLFGDRDVMERSGVTDDDIARFLNGYTIADNWPKEDLPSGYEDRGDELIFEAAFPSTDLPDITTCAAAP